MMKKTTQFKDHIDVGYLWLLEVGLLRYLDMFWAEERPKCVHETDFAPVGIQVLFPAFTFLSFFWGVSLVFVNLEKVWFLVRKNIKKRR